MKYNSIPNQLFISNRANLLDQMEEGSVALIFSNHQMPRNGDQFFSYRQSSDFFYLTGIEQEKSALMLQKNTDGTSETLFILKSFKELEIWEGHKLTFEEARDISGIQSVKFIDDLELVLHLHIPTTKKLYFNIPETPKFKAEVKTRDEDYAMKIKREYPMHEYGRLAPLLADLRLIKSPEELSIIRKACEITRDAFIRVMATMQADIKEYEVEAEVSYEFLKQGASGHAYAPIMASGANACALHYIENDQVCKSGDLILMDFGAEYANYSADLSRTIPVSGQFSPRQKEMYEACLRVFKFAKSLMVPGTTINKFHKEVCKKWEEEHIKLGLYTAEEAMAHKGENPLWFKYFMHGTSHFMGLDVHDVGTRDTEFRPGMVLTCEPGIYVEEEGIGIRIENDILITENGNEDLMEDIPIEADHIESIMKMT